MTPSSPLIGYDDAAAYLRVSTSKVARLVAVNAISHRRVGRRVFFTLEDLDAFIEASRVDAAPAVAAARPIVRRGGRAGGPNLSVIGQRR